MGVPDDKETILLIDGLSVFTRNYLGNPLMSTEGELMGGAVGTASLVSRISRQLKPKNIYMVWESGGSKKRRAIYPEYKANRKPKKMNRFYGKDIPDSPENEMQQKIVAVKLLKTVPVCQIYVPNCEADDVIGYLCRNRFKNNKKIIVSSDKDYYQLLDSNTWIYSPGKKIFIYEEDVKKEFDITAKNFCVAKAFCGDSSDNIKGIDRVGFKNLPKKFPILGSDHETSVEELLTLNEQKMVTDKKAAKLKIHQRIKSNSDIVRRNWKLMYLDTAMLSIQQINKINKIIDSYKPKKSKFRLIKVRRKFQLEQAIDTNLFMGGFSHFTV